MAKTIRNISMLDKTLARALSLMRPHGTQATAYFTDWLFDNLPKQVQGTAWLDSCNNLHVDNRLDETNRTLFVAHVDTVHREVKPNKIRKTKTMWFADGAALGADDGVGCALLMHLLHADVKGYYIFTQGEECGGIGAKHLAKEYPELLSEFSRAIAFDRRGVDSVITHQGWGRCCSDAFGDALSSALNQYDETLMYSPDNTGVYTDTAEFVGIIPECTNVSCGYQFEHGEREQLDMVHFAALAKAVLRVDWDALPIERDPLVKDYDDAFAWDKPYKGIGMSATNDAYGVWPVGDGMYDMNEDEYLFECILDAEQGFTKGLIDLMAESVYPEDPALAVKAINRNKLTDEALTMAKGMVGHNDVDTILCTLFDMAYAE